MNLQATTPRLVTSAAFLFVGILVVIALNLGCVKSKFAPPVSEEERLLNTKNCAPNNSSPETDSYYFEALTPDSTSFDSTGQFIGNNLAPVMISIPKMNYPVSSLATGQQGKVILWVFVCESGYVGDTRIKKTSGFQYLDEAAIKHALACKYRPAIKDGVPVGMWVEYNVDYHIDR